ncbi:MULTISPECIES: hypothetical protein [unclassified Thioalkalivibrio]|uniref:hypothetical protein n=1 Tax=unclassified Thioalkalivibrio TaxID=2621013 RepID=UPI000380B402|nr:MULTISPECIES: hypothetical protein [unclassified Thioalkalivibrio]
MHAIQEDPRQQERELRARRRSLNLLVAATAAVLAFWAPPGYDSPVATVTQAEWSQLDWPGSEAPGSAEVTEFRPQLPPPGVDADQVTMEESDDTMVLTLDRELERTSGDLRSRDRVERTPAD